MRKLATFRDIDAPADVVWSLFTDPDRWSEWGPSVRGATLDGEQLELGAKGKVETVLGFELGFEITDYEPGRRWGWKVAGVDATDHLVEPIDDRSCRAGFGVPRIIAPYLAVCRLALVRLGNVAEKEARG